MIVTSVVVSIFYHSWCSVLCLNEAILNAFNDCGQFEKDASVSVVVNVENKESINDWQLSSCYWVAVWQSPVRNLVDFSVLFLFSVSVKVLPVTPLVSCVFGHRAFCTHFLRIERVVEMRRFLWWTQ